jgi:4-hydroxy-tetrahydrodipicolinate reductase
VIRVGVIGATGRVGAEVCRAVHADAGMELVAGISRSKAGEKVSDVLGLQGSDVVLAENLDAFLEAGVEVAVDFTSAEFAPEHVAWAIGHGVHIVVGTTGFDVDDVWRAAPVGVLVAPNFAIGAALMQRFAAEAARYLPAV